MNIKQHEAEQNGFDVMINCICCTAIFQKDVWIQKTMSPEATTVCVMTCLAVLIQLRIVTGQMSRDRQIQGRSIYPAVSIFVIFQRAIYLIFSLPK